jgi:isopentenyl-diphosphate delta-isomerase
MDDKLILVDLADRETGSMEKMQTHREKRLHRAFSLFVTDGRGHMLIQRRNPGKYHSGNLWCNACCSHPRKGENLPDAVRRRAGEELGLALPAEVSVRELFSFVYYADFGELAEYEYDHVFLAVVPLDAELHPDSSEIGELRWISLGELERELLENRGNGRPGFSSRRRA